VIIGENKQSTNVNKEDLTKQKEKKPTLDNQHNDDKLLEIIEDFERGQDKKKDNNVLKTYVSKSCSPSKDDIENDASKKHINNETKQQLDDIINKLF